MGHKHAGSASQFSLRICAPYLEVRHQNLTTEVVLSDRHINIVLVVALAISLVQTFGLLADTLITWPETAVFDFGDVSIINWLVHWIPGIFLLFVSLALPSTYSMHKQAALGGGILLVLIGTGSWLFYENAFAIQRFSSSIVNVTVFVYLILQVQRGKGGYVA